MLVYALDETEGKDPPEELNAFASYQGHWSPDWLQRTVRNAAVRDRIRVDFKILFPLMPALLPWLAALANGR